MGCTRRSKRKRSQDRAREPDAGDRHLPELLPHVQEAGRYDRYGGDGSGRVRQDLQAGSRGDSDERPLRRIENPDVVYRTEKEKYYAAADEIAEAAQNGQPVLVGTTSVEKSEQLSDC